MWEWVAADLAAANVNRAAVPWIVVHGHRPLYCSCDGDCDYAATTVRDGIGGEYGMETLFYNFGVDLYLCGHEHDYEVRERRRGPCCICIYLPRFIFELS